MRWKCDEMRWNAMECNGMRWIAMECNGMQWNAMECNGMQWNARVVSEVLANDSRSQSPSSSSELQHSAPRRDDAGGRFVARSRRNGATTPQERTQNSPKPQGGRNATAFERFGECLGGWGAAGGVAFQSCSLGLTVATAWRVGEDALCTSPATPESQGNGVAFTQATTRVAAGRVRSSHLSLVSRVSSLISPLSRLSPLSPSTSPRRCCCPAAASSTSASGRCSTATTAAGSMTR